MAKLGADRCDKQWVNNKNVVEERMNEGNVDKKKTLSFSFNSIATVTGSSWKMFTLNICGGLNVCDLKWEEPVQPLPELEIQLPLISPS